MLELVIWSTVLFCVDDFFSSSVVKIEKNQHFALLKDETTTGALGSAGANDNGSTGANDNGSAGERQSERQRERDCARTVMATARLVWPDLTTMLKPRHAQA